jgi:hypothetical protein
MIFSHRSLSGGGAFDRSASNSFATADQLFAALDGQVISSRGDRWELRIFGIHPNVDRSWLQLRLSGPQQIDALIAVDCEKPEEVLQAIRTDLDRYVAADLALS